MIMVIGENWSELRESRNCGLCVGYVVRSGATLLVRAW